MPRIGGPCDHRKCLARAHPDGCRSYAPAAFELQPGDVELVASLWTAGWVTQSGSDGYIARAIPGGLANIANIEQHDWCRKLTPAQWRALRRIEQGRSADER